MRKKSNVIALWALMVMVVSSNAAWGDLVALWKFDGTSGNVVADSSGNGIDGVLRGAAAIVNDAERGPVFQQNDAIANFISIADPGGLLNFSGSGPHQGSATIAAWVKSNGNWTNHDTIFSQGEWDDGIGLSIKGDTSPAGQLWLAGDGTHAVTFRSDVAVPTGSWHHVAATFAYDGTNTIVTLYLDGEPTGFAQGNGSRIPGRVTAPVGGISRIGLEDRSGSGSSPRWPFNGSIDDVAVFDTALSQAEVRAAMRGIGTQRGAASNPNPADGADDVLRDVVLSWTPGPFAATHDVYFGTSFADVNVASAANPSGVLAKAGQDVNTLDPAGRLEFGRTYYWRVDEVNAAPDFKVFKGNVWSFTIEPYTYPLRGIVATASSMYTADTGPEKTVNSSGLNTDDLHGTTDNTTWVSSATGPKPAWIQYEFDRVYKLDEMWVWNSNQLIEALAGLGARNVTIEYSVDGTAWTTLAGVPEFARAPGAPAYAHNTTVDFAGVAARYVKLTINSNWSDGKFPQTGLSEVRFYHVPAFAQEPKPTPGAADVSPDVVLSWRPGREAVSHQVYLSTDSNAVANGTAPAVARTEASYAPSALELGATYYWKVVEVNQAATPTTWESDVWSFTVVNYLPIDDFESYANESPNRMFQAWIDGYGFSADEFFPTDNPGNGTGSGVGHDIWTSGGVHYGRTIAEATIIHGGRQSMPLYYTNTSTPTSEAERTWKTAQDWTTNGADTLSLYFQGAPAGFLELSPSHILMSGVGTDIYSTTDQGRFVYKQLTGDGSIVARVDRLDNTNAWAKAGVMIRHTLDASSVWALVCWAGENGVRFQTRPTTAGAGASDTPVATAEQIAIRTPAWIKLERKGDQFNGYYATDAAGTVWKPMVWNPQTIAMGTDIFIGLAVTSHAAGVVAQAEFSGIATTGNVTGQWQSVSLGIDQPAGNLPDPLYVTVEDTAGHKATVVNSDSLAVGAGTWTQWEIPLSTLTSAGVKTHSIKKMVIGVGDKTKPASQASGLIYIDDIGYGRPSNQ